jgi:hypothetical protein
MTISSKRLKIMWKLGKFYFCGYRVYPRKWCYHKFISTGEAELAETKESTLKP